METKRLIYHCKKCGYTIAQDVTYDLYVMDLSARDMVYALDRPYRIVATRYIDCPVCSKPSFKKAIMANAVESHYNPDHECSDECLHAVTVKCSCACGGANHGAGHLPQAVK